MKKPNEDQVKEYKKLYNNHTTFDDLVTLLLEEKLENELLKSKVDWLEDKLIESNNTFLIEEYENHFGEM